MKMREVSHSNHSSFCRNVRQGIDKLRKGENKKVRISDEDLFHSSVFEPKRDFFNALQMFSFIHF